MSNVIYLDNKRVEQEEPAVDTEIDDSYFDAVRKKNAKNAEREEKERQTKNTSTLRSYRIRYR